MLFVPYDLCSLLLLKSSVLFLLPCMNFSNIARALFNWSNFYIALIWKPKHASSTTRESPVRPGANGVCKYIFANMKNVRALVWETSFDLNDFTSAVNCWIASEKVKYSAFTSAKANFKNYLHVSIYMYL